MVLPFVHRPPYVFVRQYTIIYKFLQILGRVALLDWQSNELRGLEGDSKVEGPDRHCALREQAINVRELRERKEY